jgi:hypothetical protein
MLLQLILMTEHGAAANARFYLCTNKSIDSEKLRVSPNERFLINKSVYYAANILFVNQAIDVSAVGIVEGSADFVSTGPIQRGIGVVQV